MAARFIGTVLFAVLCVFAAEGSRFGLPSIPTPSIPQINIPTPAIPKIEVPSLPQIDIPTPSIPNIEIPTPSLPEINIPSLPQIEVPSVDLPTPSLPSVTVPTPSRPSISWPSPSLPSLPSISLPNVKLPSIPTPDISGLTSLIKSPFNRESSGNRCSVSGTTATCCLNVGLSATRFNARTCGVLRFDIRTLRLVAAVTVNDKEVLSKEVAQADRLCVPLPPPATALQGCFSIYYLDINPRQMSIEACVAVSVNNIIRVQFDCVQYANGQMSITGGRTPDDSAFINLNVNQGKPQVSVARPQLSQFMPTWLG